LHQFFETQEYRFFLQGKFTKFFHQEEIGKVPVDNLQLLVRNIEFGSGWAAWCRQCSCPSGL